MKKFLVSGIFIFGFITNAVLTRNNNLNLGNLTSSTPATSNKPSVPINNNPTPTPVTQPQTQTTVKQRNGDDEGEGEYTTTVVPKTTPVVTTTPTPVVQTPPPAPVIPQGKFKNGTYTGDQADASYGIVQVAAVITNGKLSDVQFISYPNDRQHSVQVSNYSLPILKQEAISAQSANVNAVSGASYTSAAFKESLGSALAQAQ